jgi:hypothetical protein
MKTKRNGSQPKSDAVLVRLSVEEHRLIRRRARLTTEKVSEFMRSCALDRPLKVRVDTDALAELKRLGGLIKHLASRDRVHAYEYRVTFNLIQQTIRQLDRDSEGSKKKTRRP